jgi:hypothetical protein
MFKDVAGRKIPLADILKRIEGMSYEEVYESAVKCVKSSSKKKYLFLGFLFKRLSLEDRAYIDFVYDNPFSKE